MFSEDAILCAAYSAQLNDISYCTKHKIEGKKAVELLNKAMKHGERDKDKTYNRKNIMAFRKKGSEILSKYRSDNHANPFFGTDEIEHYAIAQLFFDSW